MRRLALFFALAIGLVLIGAPSRAQTNPNDLTPQQWALDRIGARTAWQAGTGSGVIVAVVDSGVDYAHDDLKANLLPGHDFVDDDNDASDEYGHGTHVAGIIGAGNRTFGTDGVAPGAKILPVRVLDELGSGTQADVTAGVKWAVEHGAKIINLSLGGATDYLFGPSLSEAVNDAWAAGAICVLAAGNDYVTSSAFTDEPAVVVTATDRNDNASTYATGVGSAKWGIAAPGGEEPTALGDEKDAIISTYWVPGSKNEYAYVAGTSQAAPHVSAALAVLLSTGKYTVPQAVQRVLETAKDIGDPGRDALYGWGRLDIAAAAKTSSPPANSSTTTAGGGGGGGRPGTTAAPGTSSTTGLPLPSLAPPTIIPDPPVDSTVAEGPQVTVAASAAGDSGHHRAGRSGPTILAALALAAASVLLFRSYRGRPVSDDV